jgi:hypothetical protein
LNKKSARTAKIGVIAVIISIVGYFLITGTGLPSNYSDIMTNDYMQTGNFYELPFQSLYPDTTLGSCVEYSKLYSHYSNDWHEVYISPSVSYLPQRAELVNISGGQVIDQYKVNLYLKCDYVSFLSSVTVSGTYQANLYNSNPVSSGFYYVGSASTNSIASKTLNDNSERLLASFTFQAPSESQLTLRSSDNSIGFSILTNTNLTYQLKDTSGQSWTSKKATSESTWVYHRALVNVKTDPTPTTATSRNEVLEITKMYQTLYPNSPLTKLDTTPTSGRQITVEVTMTNWLDAEGSPVVEIKKPNGVSFIKLNTSYLSQSGNDRTFFTRVTIPQNSESGMWKVIASNVNRVITSSKTFEVSNSVIPTTTTTTTTTTKSQCNDQGRTWYVHSTTGKSATCENGILSNNRLCLEFDPDINRCNGFSDAGTGSPTPTSTEVVQFANVGLVWELLDDSGNTINNGDTRTQGFFSIPDLKSAELISTAKNKSGDQQAFKQYNITPHLLFVSDGAVDPDKIKNYKILNSGVMAELTIVGDPTTSKITRQVIQDTVLETNGGISMPLGLFTITRENVEELARKANYPVGKYFEVQASVKGPFTILDKTTNKQYIGLTDGTTFIQEFRYGVPTKGGGDNGECPEGQVLVNGVCQKSGGIICDALGNAGIALGCPAPPEQPCSGADCTIPCPEGDQSCAPQPKGEPKPKPGGAEVCDTSISKCVQAELEKALANQPKPTDNTILYIGIVIALMIIAIVIIQKKRKKPTYPS